MSDLTQVQLLPVESGTAKRGEPDLTEQEIALIVTAGGGRYVGLLQNIPGRMETVILFASPQTRDNARAPHVTVQRCGRPRTNCQIR